MLSFLRELPIAIMRWISDLMERMFARILNPFGAREDNYSREDHRRAWWHWLWLFPAFLLVWPFRGLLAAIAFPFQAFAFPRPRRNCFLRGLPAAFLMIACGIGVAYDAFMQERMISRYAIRAQRTLTSNELGVSQRYAKRMVADGSVRKQETLFLFAIIQMQAGNLEGGSAVMSELAPDGGLGYEPAHQMRAIEVAQRMGVEPSQDNLDLLHWHLQKGGEASNDRSLGLWARYYQASGQFQEAAEYLERAGAINPSYYFNLWELEQRRGDSTAATRALELAQEGFDRKVKENSLSKIDRLQLGFALTKLKRMEEAEKVFLTGLNMIRDNDMRAAAVSFYLARFDDSNDSIRMIDKLTWLTRAMSIDLNNRGIYERLALIFARDLNEDRKAEIRELFEEALVSGGNPSIAHFGLGCLDLANSETFENGIRHLKQAVTLQPAVAVACNNLAIVLLQQSPPRLEEAQTLAEVAVETPLGANNETPSIFRETLGMVLLARKDWQGAVRELSGALEKSSNAKVLHEKLAEAYEALGRDSEADQHRAWAK